MLGRCEGYEDVGAYITASVARSHGGNEGLSEMPGPGISAKFKQ